MLRILPSLSILLFESTDGIDLNQLKNILMLF